MIDSHKKTDRLSPSEILDHIHLLARDGEGADKRWALTQLSAAEVVITLPPPMTDKDLIERVGRLLWGLTLDNAKRAFAWAYPQASPVAWRAALGRDIKYVPMNLVELYEMFPEAERDMKTGAPPGYPMVGGAMKKKRWIADYALALNDARKESEKKRAQDAARVEYGIEDQADQSPGVEVGGDR